MLPKSLPAKLDLPLISAPAPVYAKPDTGSENYNKNKLPTGLQGVKISTPSGYTSPSRIPPEVGAKAQSLLGARSSKNLPFNYGETFFVTENGETTEYLALITLHFDNHPRRFLELPDGTKEPHPPFWHPGVSIFKKIGPSSKKPEKDKEKETENLLKKLKEETLKSKSSEKININKLANLVESFESLVLKNKK